MNDEDLTSAHPRNCDVVSLHQNTCLFEERLCFSPRISGGCAGRRLFLSDCQVHCDWQSLKAGRCQRSTTYWVAVAVPNCHPSGSPPARLYGQTCTPINSTELIDLNRFIFFPQNWLHWFSSLSKWVDWWLSQFLFHKVGDWVDWLWETCMIESLELIQNLLQKINEIECFPKESTYTHIKLIGWVGFILWVILLTWLSRFIWLNCRS